MFSVVSRSVVPFWECHFCYCLKKSFSKWVVDLRLKGFLVIPILTCPWSAAACLLTCVTDNSLEDKFFFNLKMFAGSHKHRKIRKGFQSKTSQGKN